MAAMFDAEGVPLSAVGASYADLLSDAQRSAQSDEPVALGEIGRSRSLLEKLGETWPVRAAQAAYRAVTLPGDVYAGRTAPDSPEAIERSADLAGILALGGTGAARIEMVPRGSIGSSGGGMPLPPPKVPAPPPRLPGASKPTHDIPPPPPQGAFVDPAAAEWTAYHGSPVGDIERFDPSIGGYERGVFFSPDPLEAERYGTSLYKVRIDPGKTEVYDLNKLIDDPAFRAKVREDWVGDGRLPREQLEPLYDQQFADILASRERARARGEEWNAPYSWGAVNPAIEEARAKGLDTIILRGLNESFGNDQIVALTPGRVTSATSGRTLYSGASPVPAVTLGAERDRR